MNTAIAHREQVTSTEAQLRQLDVPGPRSTSYPTADRFVQTFGVSDSKQALQRRAAGAVAGSMPPLSLYVHIPFCESVCCDCACNKIITKHHSRAAPYLDLLQQEMALHVAELGRGEALSQLHLGGGSPTLLDDSELTQWMDMLRQSFRLPPAAELSIEVDPRTANKQRLAHPASLGFNRISFGIQDFDPKVEEAVHRVQSFESVRDLIVQARALGFESINADLIYGLPKQTAESFRRNVAQIAERRPHRIALYSYARLPQRSKPPAPHPERRPAGARHPREHAGHCHCRAHRPRLHLHRHGPFRTARRRAGRGQAPGLPASQLPGLQHAARLRPDWPGGLVDRPDRQHLQPERQDAGRSHRRSGAGRLPSGARPGPDAGRLGAPQHHHGADVPGACGFESIDVVHLVNMRQKFAPELQRLQAMAEMGLVKLSEQAIQVTATGWFFVRGAAMVFDKHLQFDPVRERFSRMI